MLCFQKFTVFLEPIMMLRAVNRDNEQLKYTSLRDSLWVVNKNNV